MNNPNPKSLSVKKSWKKLTVWDPAVTRSPDSPSGENKILGVGESGPTKRHRAGEVNSPSKKSKWSHRYGDRHRYVPILDDPLLPNSRRGRIRIYRRGVEDAPGQQRFVLNWFESGRNCKRTVLGDKFTAVAEADRINQRLGSLGRSGLEGRQVSLSLLLDRYFEHLEERSDAGEISTRTATRYKNALHYILQFAEDNVDISQTAAGKVDDHFVLRFKAYLRNLKIHPSGHRNAQLKPLSEAGIRFVMSVVRSAWHWALQHNPPLLPEGAVNPFCGHVGPQPSRNLVTQPELNTHDIVKLIEVADIYQLILLMPLTLYGLRAGEPCYMMVEDWNRKQQFLTVNCVPGLEYKTKGIIDKAFPVPPVLDRLLATATAGRIGGPLLPSRTHFEGSKTACGRCGGGHTKSGGVGTMGTRRASGPRVRSCQCRGPNGKNPVGRVSVPIPTRPTWFRSPQPGSLSAWPAYLHPRHRTSRCAGVPERRGCQS